MIEYMYVEVMIIRTDDSQAGNNTRKVDAATVNVLKIDPFVKLLFIKFTRIDWEIHFHLSF